MDLEDTVMDAIHTAVDSDEELNWVEKNLIFQAVSDQAQFCMDMGHDAAAAIARELTETAIRTAHAERSKA